MTSISSIPFISSLFYRRDERDDHEFDVQQDHWLSTVEQYESSFVSRMLAQALLSGKVRNLGHQQGCIAAE